MNIFRTRYRIMAHPDGWYSTEYRQWHDCFWYNVTWSLDFNEAHEAIDKDRKKRDLKAEPKKSKVYEE